MDYYVGGIDLSQIFEPNPGGTYALPTGYLATNGQDLNQLYAPFVHDRVAATNYRVNGKDLNEIFQGLTTQPPITIQRTSTTGSYTKSEVPGTTAYWLYRFLSREPERNEGSATFTISINTASGITGGVILVGGGGAGGNGSDTSGGGGGGGGALTASLGLPQGSTFYITVGIGGLKSNGKNDGGDGNGSGITYQSFSLTAGGGGGGFSYFSTTPTPGWAGVATSAGTPSGFTGLVGIGTAGGTGGMKSSNSTPGQIGTDAWVYDNYGTFTAPIPSNILTAIGSTLQNISGGGGAGNGTTNSDGGYSGAGLGGSNDNGSSTNGLAQTNTTYGAGGGGAGNGSETYSGISGVSGVVYMWHIKT